MMDRNIVYWLTDKCPHESLPAGEDMYRQWFMFVTSKVDTLFKNESTANELGICPPKDVNIIQSNFSS